MHLEPVRSREIEELLNDALAQARLLVNDPQLVGVSAGVIAQELRVAEDHRERIVDLVRHSGSHLPDRGELLRTNEGGLLSRETRRHLVERRC